MKIGRNFVDGEMSFIGSALHESLLREADSRVVFIRRELARIDLFWNKADIASESLYGISNL